MKTKILLTLIGWVTITFAQAQWTMDSVNTPGAYTYAAVNGNKAVFSNGGEWNIFDATTGVHTFGNFTISRQMIEVVSLGNKVLFGGGKYGYFADPQYTKQVNVYNSTTNTWSIWNMGTAREVGAAAGIGTKVLFAGGTGRTDIAGPVYMYNKVDIFDINTGARTSGKLSKARTNIAAGAAGTKVVFAGGWYWDMMYSTVYSNKADIYDVSTGLWTNVLLSKKRDNISVAVIGDKILFAGGSGNMGAMNNVDIYNATTNTWSVSYMPAAGYSFKTAVIGTDAYFAGYAYGVLNAIYKYNSLTSSWSTFYMPTTLSGFSMNVIDGRLVFAGGTIPGTNTYSNLVQIYDPAANSWSTEYLSMARTGVTALSIGNIGYFTGGIKTYGYPTPLYTNRVDIFTAPFRYGEPEMIIPDWTLKVYPNPATRMIMIGIDNDAVLPLDAVIMDQQGHKALAFTIYDEQTRVDVGALPAGVYFIAAVDMRGHRETVKLIKQ